MVNTGKISIQNGIIIGNYTLKTILVGFVVAFVIVIIAFKFVKQKFQKKNLFCNIKIKNQQKIVKLRQWLILETC